MRPAQKAPENSYYTDKENSKKNTSMRPAQKAPENSYYTDKENSKKNTSMRPAQKAPENSTELLFIPIIMSLQ